RLLVCKYFKKSSRNLCDAIATLAKRLCTEHVDPTTIQPILASRLIPLDKGNGDVRPIGIGEVIRRIIAKCVTRVAKKDIIETSGSLQVCAGVKSGPEAAIHAMHDIFDADDTDAVRLIDASNVFNTLHRSSALNKVAVLCPILAKYAGNTYRAPARPFVTGGKELVSEEAHISPQEFHQRNKQCWYADDATSAGSIYDLRKWWDELNATGPRLGYHPNANKCWLVIKPEKEDQAREVFSDTSINISTQGQKHLGSRAHLEEYVNGLVDILFQMCSRSKSMLMDWLMWD
ncbi:hypothetical protein AC249_AIPGENE26530, partial [Exaiptasia diaphana]